MDQTNQLEQGIMDISAEFLHKYNVSGPRYTSYPPANFFNQGFTTSDYLSELKASNQQQPVSYTHLTLPTIYSV